jgi:uncharacterized protein (DUF58 family)
MTELCAVLSFSAIQNNDKIGLIFFSDKIEKFIPPKKGKTHILRIIRELIEFKPVHTQTNISEALRYITNVIKKRSICFVISDYMDENFEEAMKLANKRHDVVALQIYDERETELPNAGLIRFIDNETGKTILADTSSKSIRDLFRKNWQLHEKKIQDVFLRSGVDKAKIRTDESYVRPLMFLFKKRGSKK